MNSPLTTIRTGRRAVLGATAALIALGRGRRAPAQVTTTIRFAFFGTEAELKAYQRLIAAFEQIHPEITIEPIGMASGDPSLANGQGAGNPYQPWLDTAFTGNNAPDVFMLSYQRMRAFASLGHIEPIGPYLQASTVLHAEDFYSNALNAFRYDGFPDDGLAGIPQNASSLVVYYNRDLFTEFGVPFPANDWTWVDFAGIAAQLTVDRDGDGLIGVYGLAVEPSISRFAAFVWGAGGELVDDPNRPTNLVLDSPAAQRGLAWFASLGRAGLRVTPTADEAREVPDLVRFGTGHAAMLIHSRRIVPTLREIDGLNWDVAPLPLGAVPANVLHSDAFCLCAGAQDKNAAWAFIEFASGPAGQTILAETGRTVPSLRSVAESDAFLKGTSLADALGWETIGMSPQNGRAFLDNIPITRQLPSIATVPAVEASFNQAFKRAFYVDGDIRAAISGFSARSRGVLGDDLTVPRTVFHEGESATEE